MHSPLLDSDLIREEIRTEAKEVVKRSLRNYFDALPSEPETGDKIDLFYVNELCANRFSVAGNEQIWHIGLVHPLLSPAIWELLLSLPSEYRATNSVYKYLLHSFAPKLERVPLDNSGFKVPYQGYRVLRYFPQGLERILQKIPLGKKYSLRKSIYAGDDIVKHNLPAIQEILLSNDGRANMYFHNDNIEKSLKKISENNRGFPQHLLSVISAKLLLRSL
jgi:hypothetical protein